MKPFIKDPSKKHGGSTEQLNNAWSFQRKVIAESKRKSRRNRRRTDKLNLNYEAE